jgi:hypothetical protein
MSTAVQNVKIVYTSDTSGLKSAKIATEQLTAEEQQLVDAMKQADTQAKKTNDTIQKESKQSANEIDKASKSTTLFSNGLRGVGAMVAGAFAVSSLIDFQKQVINLTGEFQKYRAVLTNSLGSQQQADVAMQMIADTASKTNFSVQQLTETYIKFANRGLNLTKSEMMKLADIANFTGKSIDQLTEAALDAFTGENERLKEFGITAKKNGETTAFTFKGVTTEVKNTSSEIQKYILGLGDLEGVTGATAAISGTLSGQISNLGDSYDQLLITLGNSESGIIAWSVTAIDSILKVITYAIKSKEQLEKESGLKELGKQSEFAKMKFDNLSASLEKKRNISSLEADKQAIEQLIAGEERYIKKKQELIDSEKFIRGAISETKQLEINQAKVRIELAKERLKQYEKFEKDLTPVIQEETEKQTKARIDAQTKAFNNALNNLSKAEQLAIREAKAEGQKQNYIIGIQLDYLQKRDDLYKKFGRNSKEIDKELVVQRQELYSELYKYDTEYAEKLEKDRLDRIEKQKTIELNSLEQVSKQEKVFYDELANERIQQARMTGEDIDKVEYNIQLESLLREKDLIKQKLEVANLSVIERTELEQSLVDNQKSIYDLDYENYKGTEAKKTEELKRQAEDRRKAEQQASKLALDFVREGFSYRSEQLKQEAEDIKTQKDYDLKLAGDNAQAKAQIESKYREIERQNKRKQFEADKQQALFNIAINTAQAVSKTLATAGFLGIALTAGVIALGAVQIARVNSQKMPKYKFGTRKVEGIDTGSDTVTAVLRPGERVHTTEVSNTYGKLLDNVQNISPKLANDFALNHRQYDRALNGNDKFKEELSEMKNIFKELRKDIKNRPEIHIELTEKGFKKTIVNTHSETQIVNDYFKI